MCQHNLIHTLPLKWSKKSESAMKKWDGEEKCLYPFYITHILMANIDSHFLSLQQLSPYV